MWNDMNKQAIILLLISLYIVFVSTNILNQQYINDDVRIVYFIEDATSNNFQNDVLKSYTEAAQAPVTTTLLYIYYFFAKLNVGFIFFGKMLGITLFLLSMLYAYKLGNVIGKGSSFLFAVIITLWLGANWGIFSGGLSRAFGYPLFFAFLYYLLKDKDRYIGIILILMALFYPPILLLSLITYSITALQKKKLKTVIMTSIFPVIILFLSFVNKKNFGQMISLREAMMMPEFYTGGRVPIFRGEIPFISSVHDTLYSFFNYHTIGISTPLYSNFLVILGIAALIFILMYKKKLSVPKEIWNILAASMICFILAFVFFFYLYFPARYVVPAALVFIACAVSLGVDKIVHQVKYKKIMFVSVLIFIVIFSIPKIHSSEVFCGEKELYLFLSDLPEDEVIAAEPRMSDCIPTYTKHKVLIMAELSAAYHKDFYAEIKKRTFGFFDAYYSSSFEDVQNFCKEFGVSYIVIDQKHFTQDYLRKERIYYEPFNSHIKAITQNRTGFILNAYGSTKEYEDKEISVIKC